MRTITTPDLEQTYLEISPALRSSLLRKVRQVEQAEDLAQDTLYRALKAMQVGTGRLPTTPGECRSWLYRIATNLAIDTLRRGKCLTWSNLDTAAPVPATGLDADPQDISPQLEEAEAVRAALSRLPDPSRRALVLSSHGGLTTAQMAQIFGITPGGWKMLLVRARGAFAQQYGTQKEVPA
jgi:RNA polymerase sigma factor (sigma-70 family)